MHLGVPTWSVCARHEDSVCCRDPGPGASVLGSITSASWAFLVTSQRVAASSHPHAAWQGFFLGQSRGRRIHIIGDTDFVTPAPDSGGALQVYGLLEEVRLPGTEPPVQSHMPGSWSRSPLSPSRRHPLSGDPIWIQNHRGLTATVA